MIKNKKLDWDEFLEIRNEIRLQWPTGSDEALELENAVATLKSVPDHKQFAKKLRKAKELGITMIQPRAGVALIDEHIALLDTLHKKGGADFLPSTIDSYTRQNRYTNAEDA
ncbi:MAG: methylaspartate mutase subunit E, partial [Bacillota bacterium]